MKKILFVMPTISCGGAEKALVELLKNMDYTSYEVDLMLFRKDDMYYLDQIPEQVNILENDEETKLAFDHVKHVVKSPLRLKKLNVVFLRIWQTGMSKIRKFFHVKKYYYGWKNLKKHVPNLKKEYDVAIGCLEGETIYYIVDKVKANKKIGYFHTNYAKGGFRKSFDLAYFETLDCLFAVCEQMRQEIVSRIPEIKDKVKTMLNLINTEEILEKAKEDLLKFEGTKLISIGNLRYVKGYDISAKACSLLKKDGYRFKWYILGEGSERKRLQNLIQKYAISENFVLCGLQNNPYAFLNQCDIFVQASRHEGFSTSVREAKIFGKPIVITDTPGMNNQIRNHETGTVTQYADAEALYQGIKELLDNPKLCETYQENLKNEKQNIQTIEQQMQVLYDEF